MTSGIGNLICVKQLILTGQFLPRILKNIATGRWKTKPKTNRERQLITFTPTCSPHGLGTK